MHIIIGLGNPGLRYRTTKHNMGFLAVEQLARDYDIKINKIKFKALIGEGTIGGRKVVLVKPQTFMNLSGECVRELVDWYRLPTENLTVIYDDIDLPLGKLRVRAKGSAGTHKGMKSIIYLLESDEFPRIRIGIGTDTEIPIEDYVLCPFKKEERSLAAELVEKAAKAAADIVMQGAGYAMNRYNGSGAEAEE